MTDAHGVARDRLRAFIERIERLEEEKKTIADDIKDVYGEAKGTGFDAKILRKVIQIRKQDKDERAEQEAILDTYLAALGMIEQPGFFDDEPRQPAPVDRKARAALRTSEAMHDNKAFSAELVAAGLISKEAHRENIALSDAVARKYGAGVIDPETGEILDEPRRSDSGLSIVTKHEDITAAPETANEMDRATEGSFETGSEAAEKGREAIPAGPVGADLSHAGSGESPETLCEYCNGSGDVHRIDGEWLGRCHCDAGKYPSNDGADHAAGANVGGDNVESIALRERDGTPTSNTGEGAACALPDPDRFVEDVPPTPMKRLHYAHCFPELTKAEYGRLEFSIIGIGVSRPIIRMGDVIVDGWARYNICRALGISYPVKNYSGNDVLLDVIEWQRAARNFTPAQEKKIAAELAKEIPHRADDIMAAFGLVEALEAAE